MAALKARAEAGEADAQYALAARLHADGDMTSARAWLERAAGGGHADALFTLSAAKFGGVAGVAADPDAARAGVERAASLGSAPASRLLAAHHAAGAHYPQSWEKAAELMAPLIRSGDPVAIAETACLILVSENDNAEALRLRERPGPPKDADAFIRGIAGFSPPSPPLLEPLCDRPRIGVARGAFSRAECDMLMAFAALRMAPAEIFDDAEQRGRVHPHRTAWNASFLTGSLNLPVVAMRAKLVSIAGLPERHAEPLNVLRYRRGEEYRPHHDFLSETEEDFRKRGQRVRTALIYLNDRFAGGETRFLTPGVDFRGAPGDVVVFDNVDETGKPDVTARHASLPVQSGEKWLASLWIRDRDQPW